MASRTVLADWMRWASTYQSMLVPMPKPPMTAITSMVSHQTTGKSPVEPAGEGEGVQAPASPSSTMRPVTSAGPPAAATPTSETSTMAKTATMPCRKSPITTPQ